MVRWGTACHARADGWSTGSSPWNVDGDLDWRKRMGLTVLSVAYSMAPVGPDVVGGAEQVLTYLDAALVKAGHHSVVVACEGSEVQGTLVPTKCPQGPFDDLSERRAQQETREAVTRALEQWPVDVVHMHGLDFLRCLPPPGIPVLVTLHLPPEWYPEEIFHLDRPHTYLHGVSRSQAASCPAGVRLLPEIENGVDVEGLQVRHAKRGYVMALGRICWEKGFHLALDAAARADVPMFLAGYVAPYSWHRHTFEHAIVPRLNGRRRFIGPVGVDRKRRLLTAAQCLLVPSTCPETSSLVAMEALACGTPVVAFSVGALPEIVEHGTTGFIVHDVGEMADAIHAAAELDPDLCRARARERFSLERMVGKYIETYRRIAAGEAGVSESTEPMRRRRRVA